MQVQNLWPLFFVILIPIIVVLYLLKQKAKEETFSSVLLWQEIYRNLEARTPFEKWKHNILMYLQIALTLLLIFALMAPYLKHGGAGKEEVVIVLDNSASMQYMYDARDTRLSHSIKQAKQEIDALYEDAVVTLITVADEAQVIYQGSDKNTVKKRLRQVEPAMTAGNLDNAAMVLDSIISNKEQVQVFCYTDTAFDSECFAKSNKKADIIVNDVYSKGENVKIEYINYAIADDGVEILCKVTNDGEQAVTQDVSLYASKELKDVQTVTVAAGESQVVYFAKQKLNTDKNIILQAELSQKDSLTADNVQQVLLEKNTEQKILLLSEGNVFLEKAFSLDSHATVYKTDDVDVMTQGEDVYDLYILDGIALPEEVSLSDLPEKSAVLLLHYDANELQSTYLGETKETKNCVLAFQESDITSYLEDVTFGVTQTYTYQLPQGAKAFLKTKEGDVAGYYTSMDNRNVAVLGFDIHNTDFALQTEFPIFMTQLQTMLMNLNTDATKIVNFPVAEESLVNAVDAVTLNGSQGKAKTGTRAIRNMVLIVVLLLLAVEWLVYQKQVYSKRKWQYFAVRMLVVLCIVLAMLGLKGVNYQKKTQTIFLVDVSDSMAGNKKTLEDYLNNMISVMPEKNEVGIVAFGRDTAIETFLSSEQDFSAFTANPVTTSTNIQNAVLTASSMFDEGVTKRLVLITDGSENEGDMTLSATTLKASEVELLTLQMEDSIGKNPEVYIEQLTTPEVIHVGEHYNVTVSVRSNIETDAQLSLYEGRTAKAQQEIHLTKGENQFVFKNIGEDETIAEYRAVLSCAEDTIQQNNTYVAFSKVEAQPRILLVEGLPEEAKEFEKVLQAADIAYDKVQPDAVPDSLADLNRYKAVITLDVFYDDLREGFVDNLKEYVQNYAGGYICIGGENSYALGCYRNTVLEEILPVEMDIQGENEIPKMAMAMVIDQSGSMEGDSENGSKLSLAKQAAVSAVGQFRETDEVGVLAFDDAYHWTVPMQQATDVEAIREEIETLAIGGGTSIYPALEQAYHQVRKSDAKLKHIVLLTDGQDDYSNYNELLAKINKANITVSTVAVGADADFDKLSVIAHSCGGRFYHSDGDSELPRIFAQEVYLSTNTYVKNKTFYPTIVSQHELLEQLADEGLPALHGYVAATPKQTADVVLVSDEQEPILSTWQYGLGRTVAWNTDATNEWTAEYAKWEQYPSLWSNIIYYVINNTDLGEDVLEIAKEGNQTKITYETKEYDSNTKLKAVVTDTNGETKEYELDATKPGVFEQQLDVSEVGVYNINVRKMQGDEVIKQQTTAYTKQYSMEYQFLENENNLATFIKQTNAQEITIEDDIWSQTQEKVKSSVSLTTSFLVLALLLLLLDIIVRRLAVDIVMQIRNVTTKIGRKIQNAKVWKKLSSHSKNANKMNVQSNAKGMQETAGQRKQEAQEDVAGQHKTEMPKNIAEQYKTEMPKNMAEQQELSGQGNRTEREKADKKEDAKKRKLKKGKEAAKQRNERLDMQQLLQKKKDREK